jgi:hypothetical protein
MRRKEVISLKDNFYFKASLKIHQDMKVYFVIFKEADFPFGILHFKFRILAKFEASHGAVFTAAVVRKHLR